MIPEYFPVLTKEDMVPHPIKEYEDNKGRKSPIGWLKTLFLYQQVSKSHIQITPQDRKDYEKIVDIFRKVSKMKRGENLHDWEDQTSLAKQVSALNKLRKKLGYVVVE